MRYSAFTLLSLLLGTLVLMLAGAGTAEAQFTCDKIPTTHYPSVKRCLMAWYVASSPSAASRQPTCATQRKVLPLPGFLLHVGWLQDQRRDQDAHDSHARQAQALHARPFVVPLRAAPVVLGSAHECAQKAVIYRNLSTNTAATATPTKRAAEPADRGRGAPAADRAAELSVRSQQGQVTAWSHSFCTARPHTQSVEEQVAARSSGQAPVAARTGGVAGEGAAVGAAAVGAAAVGAAVVGAAGEVGEDGRADGKELGLEVGMTE
jgi:hypothetical protein